MKAVIPCAKEEENLFPFIDSRPTGLMPLADKLIVSRLVDELLECGVEKVILVVNYRREMFEEKFSNSENVELRNQQEVSGVGSAVLESGVDEKFILVNGDVFVSPGNIQNLVNRLEDGEQAILGAPSQKAEKFGVLSIGGDRVESVEEKPAEPENTLVNTGVYALKPEFLSRLKQSGEIIEALNALVREEKVYVELVQGEWMDIGSPEKLYEAEKHSRRLIEPGIADGADVAETAQVSDDARIEAGAIIEHNAVVEGQSYIAEDAILGAGTIVKDSSIQRGANVLNADIRGSAVWENTTVDPNTSVSDSLIAEQAVVRSGTSIRKSFIGPRSHIDLNNSIRGVKFVPDARTDLSEISK